MPPPSSGEGAAMSAEERRKVEQLVALSPGCGNDGALHVLRECRGDVQAAAVHLLESAWPAGVRSARAKRAAKPATTGALRLRALAPPCSVADGRGRADPFCDVKVKKVKKKEARGGALIRGGDVFRHAPAELTATFGAPGGGQAGQVGASGGGRSCPPGARRARGRIAPARRVRRVALSGYGGWPARRAGARA